MFDRTAPIIRVPDTFVFHTAYPFSDPSVQPIESAFHSAEPCPEIVNCASDHPIQFHNNFFIQIVGSRGYSPDRILKFLLRLSPHLHRAVLNSEA